MRIFLRLLFAFLIPAAGFAQSMPLPEINAESAILIDYKSSRVLYEKNADASIPPASMTKLMTIHTALSTIERRGMDINAAVTVSKNADFRSLPPRSSLMFIEEGQNVSLLELLQGLALPSGNDAAIAVAEYLAGSVEAFVSLMNDEAERLGLEQTFFDDASGLSELNRTTAREFAEFCKYYIANHPENLGIFHMLRSFTYPKDKNLPPDGKSVYGPITQPNHNLLIGRLAWVDGLKTGYIDESGYNFAATAEKDGRRLILVTMGGPGESSYDGALKRALDAAQLFSYGFFAWTEFTPALPENTRIAVHGGDKDLLAVEYSRAIPMLQRTDQIARLRFIQHYNEISLPISKGFPVGRWAFVLDGETVQTGLIIASDDIGKGNIFRRIFDR